MKLEEGKRLANDVEDLKRILNSTAPVDVDADGALCLMLWCGKLIDKIEKLEALNNLAQDIVTHPCWLVNSEIPKSLKARRDLYVEAWNALEESE